MLRHKPRSTLGLIFFTVLIQKSEKQWKVLSVVRKFIPREFPRVIFFRQHCHNCMTAADSAVVLLELDVQWDLARSH